MLEESYPQLSKVVNKVALSENVLRDDRHHELKIFLVFQDGNYLWNS